MIDEMLKTYRTSLYKPEVAEIATQLFESEIEPMMRYFFIQHLTFPTWIHLFNEVLETKSVSATRL